MERGEVKGLCSFVIGTMFLLVGFGYWVTRWYLQFDTLKQANLAVMNGNGVSIGDLLLSLESIVSWLFDNPYRE